MSSLPILVYHHVGPSRPGTFPWLTVEPDRFARHVRWLARRGCHTLDVADVVAWIEGGPLDPRGVLITFDDAYADLERHAFPVLERAGMTATAFVVTGLLGGRNEWDDEAGGGGHSLMGAAAVRGWHERGVVGFGAHSRSHQRLAALGPEALRDEVLGSRSDLEALLQTPVQAFAYPYGSASGEARALVADVFVLAFGLRAGRNGSAPDRVALRRTMVQRHDSSLDLAQRLLLGRSLTSSARQALGQQRRRLASSSS